ncbi:MAG: DUF2127 domain-containing protein [Pseudomonadota bacterium]|nr:DUF2127 domain-containing protein [Pseudomonadota bacterium]
MLKKNTIRAAFKASLFFKAAFALAEIVASVFAYVATKKFVVDLVQSITAAELTEDPRDFVATNLFRAAQEMSMNSQYFVAAYLLTHGVVKLWLIRGLWQKKLGYYPAAIMVFGFFIVYQMYRYSVAPSLPLLLITILDIAVIGLTWIEYKHLLQPNVEMR